MSIPRRRNVYAALWAFALAFGWIEGASVVYLRATAPAAAVSTVQFPLTVIPPRLIWVEVVREAGTMIMLAAVAWAAARRWRDAVGAFLLTFGIWDLAYYAVLWVVLGWPDAPTNWDVLFLIPLPWIAPVWAPATIAAVFVAAGSYLFWTFDRPHTYLVADFAVLVAAALVIIAAFLVEWHVVFTLEPPQDFPFWLFWAGVTLGIVWFVHAERRRVAHA